MVTRVLTLFYREIKGLHQAAYILALFTLASQILAVVRDRILAHQFGAGPELDIYYAAFRIPDLLFVLFASVLSVYVLLPFVTRAREEKDDAAGAHVLSVMFSLFLCVYAVGAVIVFIAAPYLVPLLFSGFDSAAYTDIILLLRILLLQPLLLGVSSLLGVVTQLQHRFVVYALSPLVYNIGIIIGVTVFYPLFGVAGLAYGVVLGAVGHVLVQLPLVYHSSLSFQFIRKIDIGLILKVTAVAIPRALTLSLNQIQFMAFVSIASFMAIGSISVLQFAYNLQSVPLAIIGMSYSVAAFPTLTELIAKQKQQQFNEYVITALRHIIFWSVPIIALVIVLRAQIVRVLLGSGSFDWGDTRLTAATLGLFVLSLTAQALLLLLIRALYAGGKTWVPFVITIIGSLVGIATTISLYYTFTASLAVQTFMSTLFRLEDIDGVEVLTLPLGFTIGVLIELILMTLAIRFIFKMSLRSLFRPLVVAAVAAAAGGVATYGTLAFIVEGVNQNTFIGIFLQGLAGGIVGLMVVISTYYIFRSPELSEIYKSFKTRLFKTDVVAPQPDVL